MRWLLMLVAACGSDFQETLYIHVNDAKAVTIGEKTSTTDFEIDRTFSSEDDATDARIPMVIHFADQDMTMYVGAMCPHQFLDFNAPDFVDAACSFYMAKHTDAPKSSGGEGVDWDCGCTDTDGNSSGNSSANPDNGLNLGF